MLSTSEISVIIPTLNEEGSIGTLIGLLQSQGIKDSIVSDGGSLDSTTQIAEERGVNVIRSPKGRGLQLNYGAAAAEGDTLLFLHADTLPPDGLTATIREALSHADVALGAFSLSISDPAFKFRVVEILTNLRSRLFSLPYGDQGLFIKRSVFISLGGFSEIPLMEDYDIVRRVKKFGKVLTLESRVKTSGRRWRSRGLIRTFLTNQALIVCFRLGISPRKLWNVYYKT